MVAATPSVTMVIEVADPSLAAAVRELAEYLRRCGLAVGQFPDPASAILIFADRPLADDLWRALQPASARSSLLLAGPTLHAWRDFGTVTDLVGLLPGRRMPTHEIRLRPGPGGAEVTARMEVPLLLTDSWVQLDKVADDVEVALIAHAGLAQHPVLTLRRHAGTAHGALTIGTRAETVADPAYRRLVLRWLRAAAGQRDPAPLRVGMLGYGAVGSEHAAAIGRVQGLELAAVCDLDPARVAAARQVVPELTAYAAPDELIGSDSVDLVIVSTPPNTHADWALRALEREKSVVVEKPFAITVADADAMISFAADRGRTLAVYQNRRWDSDYRALRAAVHAGAIGKVFHYESFIGGYGHPCNYWHSDAEVSGGAIYDWGAHYLDWIGDLLPQPVASVTAHEHHRVWHDVTNADATRVSVRFADGVEADFQHSDMAAAPKPKWYVLGTRGALVGSWRRSAVLSRDPVGNLVEDRLALAESPAELALHTADGSVTALALPPALDAPFHRELADLMLCGAPMSVTAQQARRTVAVLAAATESIRRGGVPVSVEPGP